MFTLLTVIFVLIGLAAFLMAFFKDSPSAKKPYKIIALVFMVLLPFLMTDWLAAFNFSILYAILAIGLNILLGNAGQISLGHAAFYALGAYAAGTLTTHAGIPIFLAIFLGGIITAILAFIVGTPILRLKGHFLGIATLGLHVLVENLIKIKLKHIFVGAKLDYEHTLGAMADSMKYSLRDILGSWDYSEAILGKAKPFLYDFINSITSSLSEIFIFFSSIIILILLIYMARNILRTKVGRALSALRDSEIAARMLGVNISIYKNIAFALSAFYAGIAGGLFAHSIGTVDEASFGIIISLVVLAMIFIGGIGAIQGAILGATFFKLLDMKIIKLFLGDNPKAQVWSPFIMGAALVLVIIFAPKGLVYMLYQLKLKITQKRG